MVRITAICMILLHMALGAGCGDDDPAGPGCDEAPVMSLDVGNTWHYVSRDNEPGAALVPFSRTVVSHETITHGDRTFTVAVEEPVPDADPKNMPDGTRLLRNEADGLYDYGSNEFGEFLIYAEPRLVAPRDGRPGDRFSLGPDRVLECVAADSLVTTLFGEVEADVYRLILDEGTVIIPDIHVVPGVGLTLYYNTQFTIYLENYDFD